MSVEFNIVTVLGATVATIPVGAIWYEVLFKKSFAELTKLKMTKEQEKEATIKGMSITFISSLLTSIGLLYSGTIAASFYQVSFGRAVIVSAILSWLIFFALKVFMHDTFELRPRKLSAIHTSYDLACFMVSAFVLALIV